MSSARAAIDQKELPIEAIVPNARQPRTEFDNDSIRELAASIAQVGLLQPLVVRPIGNGRYELIAGERRLRASQLAGLSQVPVLVRPAGAQHSLELALVENIQREDLSAIEAAVAYRTLAEEFGLTQEAISEKIGKSRVAVTNTLRLLKLPQTVQEGLRAGKISEGHARAILSFPTMESQLAAYEAAIRRDLTVREVEALGKAASRRGTKQRPRVAQDDALEGALSERFGSPVRLYHAGKDRRIEITVHDDEDLERVLDVLGITI